MKPTKYRIWDKFEKKWKETYSYHLAPNGQLYYGGMNITEHNEVIFFTGLHDDHDDQNEIFDQDILEVKYEGETIICKVQYESGGYLLASDEFDDGFIWASEIVQNDRNYFWIDDSKVIGNYFEHRELMNTD